MAHATTLSRRTPQQVFEHHMQAVRDEDLDAVLQDYAETACIIIPAAVIRGTEDLRTFFARLTQMLPHAQWHAKTTSADNILLLEWTADSARASVSDGVDTFVFQNGLIHYQTVHFTLVPRP